MFRVQFSDLTHGDADLEPSTSNIGFEPEVRREVVIDTQDKVSRRPRKPRLTNRRLLWLIVLASMVVPLLISTLTRVHWVGGFDLNVTIQCRHPAPITSIRLRTGFDSITAAPPTLQLAASTVRWTYEMDPFRGDPISIQVRSAGESDVFLDYRYSQECCLYVVAEFADGTRIERFVDIPDGRQNRSITVTLP